MLTTEATLESAMCSEMPAIRILCIDDNRDCADSLAMLLSTMGLQTETCYSGSSALIKNEDFRPKVCFLDLNMPGMDGDVLAQHLRDCGRWNPTVLIAMTAMSNEASRERIAAAGFDLHLVKPLEPSGLSEALELVSRILQSYPGEDESRLE